MREGELGRQVLEKGLNLQPFGKMLTGLSQLLHGGLLVSSCSALGTLPLESPQLWGEESSTSSHRGPVSQEDCEYVRWGGGGGCSFTDPSLATCEPGDPGSGLGPHLGVTLNASPPAVQLAWHR